MISVLQSVCRCIKLPKCQKHKVLEGQARHSMLTDCTFAASCMSKMASSSSMCFRKRKVPWQAYLKCSHDISPKAKRKSKHT